MSGKIFGAPSAQSGQRATRYPAVESWRLVAIALDRAIRASLPSIDSENRGAREGAAEERLQPPVALDHHMPGFAQNVWQQGREQELVSEALLPRNEKCLARQRLVRPARLGESTLDCMSAQQRSRAGLVEIPASREVAHP